MSEAGCSISPPPSAIRQTSMMPAPMADNPQTSIQMPSTPAQSSAWAYRHDAHAYSGMQDDRQSLVQTPITAFTTPGPNTMTGAAGSQHAFPPASQIFQSPPNSQTAFQPPSTAVNSLSQERPAIESSLQERGLHRQFGLPADRLETLLEEQARPMSPPRSQDALLKLTEMTPPSPVPRRQLPWAKPTAKQQSKVTESPSTTKKAQNKSSQPSSTLNFSISKSGPCFDLPIGRKRPLPNDFDDSMRSGVPDRTVQSTDSLDQMPSTMTSYQPTHVNPGLSIGSIDPVSQSSVPQTPANQTAQTPGSSGATSTTDLATHPALLQALMTPEDLASRPTAERMALLESWICRQLENPDFVALCEDMDGCWRRIMHGR